MEVYWWRNSMSCIYDHLWNLGTYGNRNKNQRQAIISWRENCRKVWNAGLFKKRML